MEMQIDCCCLSTGSRPGARLEKRGVQACHDVNNAVRVRRVWHAVGVQPKPTSVALCTPSPGGSFGFENVLSPYSNASKTVTAGERPILVARDSPNARA